MPKFLEKKLAAKYDSKDPAIKYKIMNALGFMHGNKETAKGAAAEAKHERDKGTHVKGAENVEREAYESFAKHKDKDEKMHKEKTKIIHQGKLDDKTLGQMSAKFAKLKGRKGY